MKQQTFVDCRVGSFGDDAIRIIALCDTQNDQVVIAKTLSYMPPKNPYKGKTADEVEKMKQVARNTVIAVDNNITFDKWDLCFIEAEHLDEAIHAYYLLDRTKCLILSDDVMQQCSPKNIIEVRKMDVSGKKYELNSDEVTNSNMGVLIVCWAVMRMRKAAMCIEDGEDASQDDIDNFDVPFVI